MESQKFYWLRLKRDFFKRHDIRIIESMPNGKDYILFYLKLLCESVDHEGSLRFSENIPYDEFMLSTITDTNIDIVRGAIKIFTSLDMMTLLDDGTFFMNEVEKMIGTSTQDEHTRESTRLRVQAFRERQKQAQIEQKRYSNVTCNGEIEKEIEIEIEKDKEIEKKEKDKKKKPVKEAPVYFPNDEKLNKAFEDYIANRKALNCPMTPRAIELAVDKVKNLSGGDNEKAIAIINQSIENGWKGLFELKNNSYKKTTSRDEWAEIFEEARREDMDEQRGSSKDSIYP